MPHFEKLTNDEIAGFKSRRGVDLRPYEDFMQALNAGDWARVTIGENEKKSTVKRRMTVTANRMGKKITYRRSEPRLIMFEVTG